jgi:hypothetical protein
MVKLSRTIFGFLIFSVLGAVDFTAGAFGLAPAADLLLAFVLAGAAFALVFAGALAAGLAVTLSVASRLAAVAVLVAVAVLDCVLVDGAGFAAGLVASLAEACLTGVAPLLVVGLGEEAGAATLSDAVVSMAAVSLGDIIFSP